MPQQLDLPLNATSTASAPRVHPPARRPAVRITETKPRTKAEPVLPPAASDRASEVFRLEPSPGSGRPTTADIRRLERILGRRLGRRLVVKITKNRRHLVTGRVREGVLHARIHILFLTAPDSVLDAVARFFDPDEDHEQAEREIQTFVTENRDLLTQTRARSRERTAQGAVHDLERLLDDLNTRFFDGRLSVEITWSRGAKGQRRRSMQLGAYVPEENLIRIHPALDQGFVPAYFVSCVIFHEMLHAVHGVTEQDGRRRIHSPAFVEDERRHPDYARARRWENRNLKRLLRY